MRFLTGTRGGEFYVTTGLLQKANDDELRAVLAHESAHADLGHVAKLQRLGTGLQIGAVLLEQSFPRRDSWPPWRPNWWPTRTLGMRNIRRMLTAWTSGAEPATTAKA
jgi:Zn-dependent protease with chaperone function